MSTLSSNIGNMYEIGEGASKTMPLPQAHVRSRQVLANHLTNCLRRGCRASNGERPRGALKLGNTAPQKEAIVKAMDCS